MKDKPWYRNFAICDVQSLGPSGHALNNPWAKLVEAINSKLSVPAVFIDAILMAYSSPLPCPFVLRLALASSVSLPGSLSSPGVVIKSKAGRSLRNARLRDCAVGSLQALADFLEQVNGAAAITPLVVVPAHKLEELLVQLDATAGSRISGLVDKVRT